MNELVLMILLWIGEHTDYDVGVQSPNIVMIDAYNLCANYGIADKGSCQAAQLQGFYDKKFTIYLRTGFDPNNRYDQSRLTHELVHYVQWMNGRHKTECLGRLELEAYTLQDTWRAEFELQPVLGEFKKIMLAASCDA